MYDDGYCGSCGHRQPEPRDHVEVVDGPVVAVSDRGQRHHHNEDAVAVASLDDGTAILVVCDGVSSTPGSADVSTVAATAMVDALSAAFVGSETPPEKGAVPDEALLSAVDASRLEAETATMAMDIDELNPPSTTLVAAVARRTDGRVAVSVVWLGDSRAYWLDGSEAELLTADHEINGALTRWVGIDAMSHQPETAHHLFDPAEGPKLDPAERPKLIVCSDGMWRYFSPDLGEPAVELVSMLEADGLQGLELVRAMVDRANELGGHDNISVAYWPAGSSDESETTSVDPTSERSDDDPPKEPMT